MTSVSNLAAQDEATQQAPAVPTPLEYAIGVLDKTKRHPDAPSTVPLYLRALLTLAVEHERREIGPAGG